MTYYHKDYTSQEKTFAKCIEEFGLRYQTQYSFPPYIVDFYIPEVQLVIEADGMFGHLKKADAKRDANLLNNYGKEIRKVFHISETSKIKIIPLIEQILNEIEEEDHVRN
jgi:very-short-patch-repair endonuclease